jgi:hypothetical protein
MATYVLPQVLVFQDFQALPAAVANPLRAHISGAHNFLTRFAETDEREDGELDFYDPLTDEAFLWPNRPAGGIVDQDFTKLWMVDALLRYFADGVGSGSTITKVSGFNNRVVSDTVNWVTNGSFARDPLLFDRDVQIGDTVEVRCVPGGGDPVTIWTFVKDFVGEIIAAIIEAATADTDNAATQGASASAVQTDGPENCITLAPDGAAYDGLPSGDISEVYTIVVEKDSTGGDLTTAEIRVLSASGNDDQSTFAPNANGVPTPIGTRGLTVTFADDDGAACSLSADAEDPPVSPNDLIAGQRFDVTVAQDFTATTPTSAGAYTGDNDTTYIIEVTRGGEYAAALPPQITVSTTTGVDISGPTTVPAAATAVAVGTEGVTVAFDGPGLRLGDRFFITVVAEAEGPMRTLVLGHNIPDDVPGGTECGVTLFIRKPTLQIERNRTGFAPIVNFETSETEITVKAGITVFEETWTDGGTLLPLDVISEDSQNFGKMYVEYKAFLQDLCNEVGTIDDVALLNDQISGALDPANELKWGVFKALSNSNGTEVKYSAICDPESDEAWIDMLALLLGRDDVYGLTPLTKRRTVLDLFAAHVDGQSTPEEGLWRVAWFNLSGVPEKAIVTSATSEDGEIVLAVVEDDPNTSGTQYTIVRVPASNGDFETNDVRPGDIVRMLYTTDGFGNETFSEFVVDEVQNEDQLRLLSGPGAAINVAAKIEIHRNLSATEEAQEIALDAGAWNNRRIRAIWPDTIETSGTVQNGYFLTSALAGLSSGILPHQGMTNLEIAGFTDVPRTTSKFNKPQLDIMAVAGTWIVTQDLQDGEIYSRHAVTTGDYEDINQREEMITRNVDSISYRFKDHFAPFIGVSNVTPSLIELLGNEGKALIEVLKTENFTQQLGGQLIDATIIELRPHFTLKDRVVMVIDTEVPIAMNNLEIHLVV